MNRHSFSAAQKPATGNRVFVEVSFVFGVGLGPVNIQWTYYGQTGKYPVTLTVTREAMHKETERYVCSYSRHLQRWEFDYSPQCIVCRGGTILVD